MKRVVTGHDPNGNARFITIDTPSQGAMSKNGGQVVYCWATSGPPVIPVEAGDPTLAMTTHYPQPGDSSCVVVRFPGEFQGRMHMTDSVDYVFVLSGEIWLVLETGEEVRLTPGDCVIQNGTRHAWQNRTASPCEIIGVMIGGTRKA